MRHLIKPYDKARSAKPFNITNKPKQNMNIKKEKDSFLHFLLIKYVQLNLSNQHAFFT